jgi:hypothetical protein
MSAIRWLPWPRVRVGNARVASRSPRDCRDRDRRRQRDAENVPPDRVSRRGDPRPESRKAAVRVSDAFQLLEQAAQMEMLLGAEGFADLERPAARDLVTLASASALRASSTAFQSSRARRAIERPLSNRQGQPPPGRGMTAVGQIQPLDRGREVQAWGRLRRFRGGPVNVGLLH